MNNKNLIKSVFHFFIFSVVVSVATIVGAQERQRLANEEVFAFIVAGDTQLGAEDVAEPAGLSVNSAEPVYRVVDILNALPNQPIPESVGGGVVSDEILGMIIAGDLIHNGSTSGGNGLAMRDVEWQIFKQLYGVNGEGEINYHVYEMHGNHDGPLGDTVMLADIAERNLVRWGVINISPNGYHYSWDWGGIHFVSLGIFVGDTNGPRDGRAFAPLDSMQFLRDDLAEHVGDSGQPVIINHHFHLAVTDAFWPTLDKMILHNVLADYNVAAIFHGHSHQSPPSLAYWDGSGITTIPGGEGVYPVINPDDISFYGNDEHGFLYVEIINRDGIDNDEILFRSLFTQDDWETYEWHEQWSLPTEIEGSGSVPTAIDLAESSAAFELSGRMAVILGLVLVALTVGIKARFDGRS